VHLGAADPRVYRKPGDGVLRVAEAMCRGSRSGFRSRSVSDHEIERWGYDDVFDHLDHVIDHWSGRACRGRPGHREAGRIPLVAEAGGRMAGRTFDVIDICEIFTHWLVGDVAVPVSGQVLSLQVQGCAEVRHPPRSARRPGNSVSPYSQFREHLASPPEKPYPLKKQWTAQSLYGPITDSMRALTPVAHSHIKAVVPWAVRMSAVVRDRRRARPGGRPVVGPSDPGFAPPAVP
jgi:hypothetical protein